MIDVKDRVPSQVLTNGAIRYEEFDAEGNSLGYKYIKRADEPVEAGTPINKALFDSIKADFNVTNNNIVNHCNRFFTPGWKDEKTNVEVTTNNPVLLYSNTTSSSTTIMEFDFGIKIEELRMSGDSSSGTTFTLQASEDGITYENIASGKLYIGFSDVSKYTFEVSSTKVYKFLKISYSSKKALAITLARGTLYNLPKYVLNCSDYKCGEGKKHFFVYFPELLEDVSNLINKYYGAEAYANGALISNNDTFIASLKKYYIEFADKTKSIQNSSGITLNNCYFLYQKEEDLIPIIMQ